MGRWFMVLLAAFAFCAGSTVVLGEEGLVAHWKFDEGAGETVADASGNGNNGTIMGAVWTDGVKGAALQFDGVSSYVRVPDSPSLNITSAMTIEAWIRSNSTDGARVIVSKWDDANSTWSYIFKDHNDTDTLRIELSKDIHADLIDLPGTNAIPLGEWAHVAVTFEGTTVRLYLNGVLDAEGTTTGGTIDSSWAELQIGAISGGEVFDGMIDEVRIYNKAVSAKQIKAHYEAVHDGLAGFWSFDERQGAIARDGSGNGNDGVIQGASWAGSIDGSALSFDGASSYVQVPSSASLNPSGSLTIEACIKSAATDGARVIVSKWDDNAQSWSYIFKDHNDLDTLRMELSAVWHADLTDLGGVQPITTGKWIHVATTYDGASVKLYFDGNLDSELATSGLINASATDLLIGAVNLTGGPSEFFSGIIDEVRLYSSALTADRVQSDAVDCRTVSTAVDVKPGTTPNTINLKSKGGVLVAILGSSSFDVTAVDGATLMFAGSAPSDAGTLGDVNADGIMDRSYHFSTQGMLLKPADTTACAVGRLQSGVRFEGCDTVVVMQ